MKYVPCIVRGPSLSEVEALSIGDLGHVHIPELCRTVLAEEDIRRLNVSVHNVQIVYRLETEYHLMT